MEGQPMVSYSAGSMNSLVDKLTKLKGRPSVVEGLKQDLVNLKEDFFHKVAGRREMNLQIEAWMKIVRELVFDMEDWVDQKPDMGDPQLEIEEVQIFKAGIEHARELFERYDLVNEVPTDLHPWSPAIVPSQGKVDSRILFGEQTRLVGVESPTELVKLLTGEHEKRLRVVSIVGMEGLGKTTLAKEIYAKLHLVGEFDCWASVFVGKRPSMRNTLMEILRQVKLCKKERVKLKRNLILANEAALDLRIVVTELSKYLGKKKRVKLKPNPIPAKGAAQDLRTLVTKLSKYLGKKRYFILVDGLWSTRAWKIINCALPNKNRGSRVLITTCMSDVAKFCSVRPTDVYQMKALGEKMSRTFYHETIGQEQWPDDHDEATESMLKMCGGMPLAIEVTAGLLATKSEKVPDLKNLGRSILSSVEQYSTSEGMTKLLHMSYVDLSLPLKSCLLYLSVFRENRTIRKDRLIRLWIAEGFIPGEDEERGGEEKGVEETTRREKETRRAEEIGRGKKASDRETRRGEETTDEQTTGNEEARRGEITGDEETGRDEEIIDQQTGTSDEIIEENIRRADEIINILTRRGEESLWDTGESYFNELIMRRLIRPVFNYDDDQAVGCTVHSVILDFVKSLSGSSNFVTVGGAHLGTDTVRRFSLDCNDDQHEDGDGTLASIAVHLSRVRSVTVLEDIEGMDGRSALTESGNGKIEGGSVLPCFKLIRVLDLEGTVSLRSHHLQGIGGLLLLKYLGVAGTDVDELPEEVGNLEHLETLDLRHTKLSTLPVSIAKQTRLAHLLIESTVRLPMGILQMQGLEEVSTIGLDSSPSTSSVPEFLRKSQLLKVLGVRLDGSSFDHKDLFRVVARSTELRSLSIECLHDDLLGLLLECPPSEQLRRFSLTISAPVHKKIAHRMACLVSVTHMNIDIVELDAEVVRVLGELSNLVFLKLVSSGITGTIFRMSTKRRCDVGVDHGFNCLKVFSLTSRSGGTELQFTPRSMNHLQRLCLGFSARKTLTLYGSFSFGIEHLSSLTRLHVTIDCKRATVSEVENAEVAIRVQVGKLFRNPTIEFTRTHQEYFRLDHKAKVTKLLVQSKKLLSRRSKE